MTATHERTHTPQATRPPLHLEEPTPEPRRTRIRRQPSPTFRLISGAVGLLALLMLGFVGYLFGLSDLSEARSQQNTFKSFQKSLGEAVAPVGPTAAGTPVALLDIPAIGIRNLVVAEGTDARTMTMGPGHRRDTPLPGQAGVSVVFGRRATFGAPFAQILKLQVGDHVRVTTGQGISDYVVSSFGAGARTAPANADNRLVLTTADSSFAPSSTVSVSADLRSAVRPAAGARPPIGSDERSMAGASDRSLLPLALWGQALLVLSVLATVATHRWARWPTWLCASPAILAVLWNVYENAATLLPNLF